MAEPGSNMYFSCKNIQAILFSECSLVSPQMAPEHPDLEIPSSEHSTSSSDSDSGCALEDYSDIKAHPSAVQFTLPNSDGQEINLIRTLLHLLPPQDCDEKFCTGLGDLEKKELRKLSTYRRLHSMRHGITVPVTSDTPDSCCSRCGGKILVGDTAVHTERIQDEGFQWHLGCFVCETCHLPLSQFIYFLQDSRIYCGRHHAELTRSRCAACDQLILTESFTVAEGHCWHVEHFCCWECEVVLGGGRYVMEGGRPFCNGCFQRLYAETCEACGEPVDPDEDLVTLKGQYWHLLPSCFCCSCCKAPLPRSAFIVHEDHLYCSQSCLTYDSQVYCTFRSQRSFARPTNNQCSSPRNRSQLNCRTWNDTVIDYKGRRLNPNSSITRFQPRLPKLSSETDSETNGTWCPEYRNGLDGKEETSGSSSESEPEGFFLGRPIQNYSLSRGTDSPVHIKSNSVKRRQRGKNCKVS
ncbi:prickle-like protein 4 isoform X2 [Pyxicephalus adspersus]|uniref:prickle-like protein 4 isoform X2 n=1 Tax=Pyxicephalus adspersus TaxID=30357 RepID=UPI003B59DEFE